MLEKLKKFLPPNGSHIRPIEPCFLKLFRYTHLRQWYDPNDGGSRNLFLREQWLFPCPAMQYINFHTFSFFLRRWLTPTYRFRIVLQNSMNGSSLYRRRSASRGHSDRGSNRGDLPRVLLFFLFLRHRPKYAITRHERFFFSLSRRLLTVRREAQSPWKK